MALKLAMRATPVANMADGEVARRRAEPRGAIFLDKDGTLLVDVPHSIAPERMRFAPGVHLGLRLLAQYGMPLIVVSNQPGVAMGIVNAQQLNNVGRHLQDMFSLVDASLTAFRWCPHLPGNDGKPACNCRKPGSGLLLAAAQEFNIDLEQSWMVGDILNDVEAGARVGCRTILIDNGSETEWQTGAFRRPDYLVRHFGIAARIIAQALVECEG